MDELETGQETVAPPIEETDYTQGYEIRIQVRPDRFTVSGPSPLPQGEPEESDEEETNLDLTAALKSVIAIYKDNPLDQDEAAHFDAGYSGR